MSIDKAEDLVKSQMKVIDKLQEEKKLLQFELSKTRQERNSFKEKYKGRVSVIRKTKEELQCMKKDENFSGINKLIKLLREVENEE